MPYNNEYNRSISRDIDYFNKRYIAHCDSTGTGTQNYRVQMATGLSGGGAGCAPSVDIIIELLFILLYNDINYIMILIIYIKNLLKIINMLNIYNNI